jgi:hypothetical protein
MTRSFEQASAKLNRILADSRAGLLARIVNANDGYYVEFKRDDSTVWRRIPQDWLDRAQPGDLGQLASLIEHVRRALDA